MGDSYSLVLPLFLFGIIIISCLVCLIIEFIVDKKIPKEDKSTLNKVKSKMPYIIVILTCSFSLLTMNNNTYTYDVINKLLSQLIYIEGGFHADRF